jgi:hypothetical protein
LSAVLISTLTSPAWAAATHRYTFNDGTANDSVGTVHGTLFGGAAISGGSLNLTAATQSYVDLNGPAIAINGYTTGFSLELWLKSNTANTGYTMAAVLGRSYDAGAGEPDWAGYQYIMIQPTRGGGPAASRIAITNNRFEEERGVNGPTQINDGLLHQIVTTVSPTTISYYVDGALLGTNTMNTTTIAGLSNNLAYLGKSVYQFDPYFDGSIDQFTIYDNVLTGANVLSNFNAGPIGTGSPTVPKLTIDRVTGAMTLSKQGAPLDVIKYTITSTTGALDPTKWVSISATKDADSGGSFDNNDVWNVLSQTPYSLSEEEPVDGGANDGGKLGVGTGATASLPLLTTGGWLRNYRENDIVMTLEFLNAGVPTVTSVLVEYTGNSGNAWKRSDFNFDNQINAADYNILMANQLKTLTEATGAAAYVKGDINGDLKNDALDFRLFKTDYIAANGPGAWAALAGVPEPASVALVACCTAAGLGISRKRRQS